MNKKIYVDLGNSNYKMLVGDKKIVDCSNIQEVTAGTFGAWNIDNKHYIIGAGAVTRKQTNKIVPEKRALLSRALYSVVDNGDKIDLVTVLPLSLYFDVANRESYINLLKGKHTITNSDGAKKSFTIASVAVYAEGFSSLITDMTLLQQPIYVVDIGGTDLDIFYVNRTPDANKLQTTEKGTNILTTQLAKVLTSKLLESYNGSQVELLLERYETLPKEIKDTIDSFMEEYIKVNIQIPLKDLGYRDLLAIPIIFTGGGSKLMAKYISKIPNAKILDNCIFSNIEGARILDLRKNGGK